MTGDVTVLDILDFIYKYRVGISLKHIRDGMRIGLLTRLVSRMFSQRMLSVNSK